MSLPSGLIPLFCSLPNLLIFLMLRTC